MPINFNTNPDATTIIGVFNKNKSTTTSTWNSMRGRKCPPNVRVEWWWWPNPKFIRVDVGLPVLDTFHAVLVAGEVRRA
ncbi:MAG: hypothetical protein IPO09_11675 [Anaeromyxobacter sp.]|nr:hypothetical protein [Anaeromyxobacter sp.]MBL0276251.1 hypothetical protein [Anaeromyxobacter sp.]